MGVPKFISKWKPLKTLGKGIEYETGVDVNNIFSKVKKGQLGIGVEGLYGNSSSITGTVRLQEKNPDERFVKFNLWQETGFILIAILVIMFVLGFFTKSVGKV